MSLRPKLQNIGSRDWRDVRDAWLEDVPSFEVAIDPADRPNLEKLQKLSDIDLPKDKERFSDIDGLRRTLLWEAVFLFCKCSHTALASQRLGSLGMHSWSLFSSYHSAYLGAKGLMALLGVALPELENRPFVMDIFPAPQKAKRRKGSVRLSSGFDDFLLVSLPGRPDQRQLWEVFQRIINLSTVPCWDLSLRDALLDLDHERITPPRNHFLYRTRYWPINDLEQDSAPESLQELLGDDLDTDSVGFLMRLNFSVYRLFEQLVDDLAVYSAPIKKRIGQSRFLTAPERELICYREFISRIPAPQPRD